MQALRSIHFYCSSTDLGYVNYSSIPAIFCYIWILKEFNMQEMFIKILGLPDVDLEELYESFIHTESQNLQSRSRIVSHAGNKMGFKLEICIPKLVTDSNVNGEAVRNSVGSLEGGVTIESVYDSRSLGITKTYKHSRH